MPQTTNRRRHLELLLRQDDALNAGWLLRVEGPRLLVDSGIAYPAGTMLTVFPYAPVQHAVLERFEARVVASREDVMVAADAPFRFLVLLDAELSVEARVALLDSVPAAKTAPARAGWPFARRKPLMTHDQDVLAAALQGIDA
ncbi:MAG: hypothetical protein R3F39_25055 [Myxococcota bacterium]